tara:strand:- start:210 stop:362 length:153 start_codon:yes stop_codon:yes gene_type:complete
MVWAFPALIRLPFGVDGKPNLMGLPGATKAEARDWLAQSRGACREMAPPP